MTVEKIEESCVAVGDPTNCKGYSEGSREGGRERGIDEGG